MLITEADFQRICVSISLINRDIGVNICSAIPIGECKMVIKFFCLTQLALNNERFNREAAINLIDRICEMCAAHTFLVNSFGMVKCSECRKRV